MAKMTKEQIQERQMAIMNRMSEMEEKSREANNGNILFTGLRVPSIVHSLTSPQDCQHVCVTWYLARKPRC